MAETTSDRNGKPTKLPPLSSTSNTEEGAPIKKVVKRKKKKPIGEGTQDSGGPPATPRRRKAAAASQSATSEGTETTPKKKKKKIPRKTEENEGEPSTARSAESHGEDVAGSKASLLSKSTKGQTPRKKKVKKKVKKTTAGEEFFDSTLAADLTDIQEDIITAEDKEEEDLPKIPYSTASAVLKSQPMEKLFIETSRGFKSENKGQFAKKVAEQQAVKKQVPEAPKNTTIAFALRTHKVLQTFCLFCHGLIAGISLWHIVMAYVLLYNGNVNFLLFYRPVALPVQCMYYILLALCTVSACDRFDVGNPTKKFLLRAVTLQSGAISVIIYLAALILSLSAASLEDRLNLGNRTALWDNPTKVEENISRWRNINTARGILSILGWFVLSITPMADRLTKNLQEADGNVLGDSVEMSKESPA
ncbi:hypothetical protein ACJMK2_020845 [Sinanodonta woodiana]|uniref:Transmembrane protein 237 n=1 Tax=Sinanodonta woodiana TaxID=1069815 RepID=A0ABD3U0R5_SINWO